MALFSYLEALLMELEKIRLIKAKDEALEKKDSSILEEELGGSSPVQHYPGMYKRKKKRDLAD